MNLAPTPRMLPEAEQDAQDPLLQRFQPQQAGNRPQRETTSRAQAEWGQAAWEDARQQEDSPAEGEGSSPACLREVRFVFLQRSCASCLLECFQRPAVMLHQSCPGLECR